MPLRDGAPAPSRFRIRVRSLIDGVLWLGFGVLLVNVNQALQARVAIESLLDTGGGSAVRQLVYFGIFGVVSLLYLRRASAGDLRRILPLPLLVLFGWAALSLGWSAVPGIALRRLILTGVIALTVLQLSGLAPPSVVMRRLRQVILVLALASLVTALAMPALGIHQPGDPEPSVIGDWRGVFYHKNIAGAVLAPGILLCLHAALSARRGARGKFVLQTVFLTFLLAMTGAKTSLGMVAASASALVVLMALARYRGGVLIGALVAVVLFSVVLGGAVLFVLGDSAEVLSPESFTGRGLIWYRLIELGSARPWLGFGFQSIFQIGWDSPLRTVFSGSRFLMTLPHAHDAYLEMFLSIGGIGLAIFLWAIVAAPLVEVATAGSDDSDLRFLCLALMLFTWTHGVLEAGLFDRDRIDWIIFLTAYGVLRRIPAARRTPAA